jgi:hypothetical protein
VDEAATFKTSSLDLNGFIRFKCSLKVRKLRILLLVFLKSYIPLLLSSVSRNYFMRLFRGIDRKQDPFLLRARLNSAELLLS